MLQEPVTKTPVMNKNFGPTCDTIIPMKGEAGRKPKSLD
jgi:hypothetical protein